MEIKVSEPFKNISVLFDDGQRRVFDPGADLVKLGAPTEVISAAVEHWTPEVLAAFATLRAAQRDAPKPPDGDRDLSKPEFEYLLASSGLEDVWDALEGALKGANRPLYAQLKSQRAQSNFSLAVTLGFVAQVRTQGEALVPGTDLSDDAIRATWSVVALR